MDFRKSRRARSKGPFARVPAWIFRDLQGIRFKHLKGSEAKLLAYLAFRSNNITDETPGFTVAGLSRSVGFSRDTTREALGVLANLGIIALCVAKQKKSFARILFTPPNDRNGATATEAQTAPSPGSTPLSLSSSTNGHGNGQRIQTTPPDSLHRLSKPLGEMATNSPQGGKIFGTQAPRKSPVPQGLEAGEKLATSSTAGHSVSKAAPFLDLNTEPKFARDDPDFLAEVKRIRGAQP